MHMVSTRPKSLCSVSKTGNDGGCSNFKRSGLVVLHLTGEDLVCSPQFYRENTAKCLGFSSSTRARTVLF